MFLVSRYRDSRLVALRDSGVGLTADGMAGVFQAFYSTKPEGMRVGREIGQEQRGDEQVAKDGFDAI